MSGINYSFSYPNPNTFKQVEIAAKDAVTGKVLGTVSAEAALDKIFNQPILRDYVDIKGSGDYVKKAYPHMVVTDLFVEQGVRKKGIGTKLLSWIVKESYRDGFDGRVSVFAGNAYEDSPLTFYKKRGFFSGNLCLNMKLDKAIKEGRKFDNSIQSFMFLTKAGAKRLLKTIL